MKLPTMYFTVTDYQGKIGVGSGGDITSSRDDAYDQYAAAVGDEQPTRAFMMEFDVETGELESTTEITNDLRDELHTICEKRGLDIPEVAQ